MPKLEITAKTADSSTLYVRQKLLFLKRMIPPKYKDKEKMTLHYFWDSNTCIIQKNFQNLQLCKFHFFSIILCQMQESEKIGLHTF